VRSTDWELLSPASGVLALGNLIPHCVFVRDNMKIKKACSQYTPTTLVMWNVRDCVTTLLRPTSAMDKVMNV